MKIEITSNEPASSVEVLNVVKAPKISLVSQIINVMNSNSEKSMKEVCDIMVATLPLKEHRKLASARSYYRELVEAGRAAGKPEPQKTLKVKEIIEAPQKAPEAIMTPEKIESIKKSVKVMAEKAKKKTSKAA